MAELKRSLNVTSATDATGAAFPLMKAASAVGAGAGSSILSQVTSNSHSFLPQDYAGWAAAIASTAAALYTMHLLCDWWWKKFWRGYFIRRGWIRGGHRK